MARKNRRENKKKRRSLLARQAGAGVMADESLDAQREKAVRNLLPPEPQQDDAAETGVRGLFSDPAFFRSDAGLVRRFVAERISCGAVDEETARTFVRKLYAMAGRAEKPREMSALSNAIVSLVRAETDYMRFVADGAAEEHNRRESMERLDLQRKKLELEEKKLAGGTVNQHLHLHGNTELPAGYNRRQGEDIEARKQRLLAQLHRQITDQSSDTIVSQ